ncbi:killer cell lectin-like receptor 7 [Grammomys surdaster]|uniref:killer cell lectin-like receptor 7 n=1 Tax=Grammomys surdaster TaxID=491861 RepID=UPI0010A0B2E7|nr:killer cell lectin-like receptor 7 [Grammomys surdaster]XP_028636782.1 killer cell lectin-like receptor 7 [Grammomys surdaster]
MSEQEVTFSTVGFHKGSGLKKPVKLEETQGPREAGHREYSVSRHLIVIALGILCTLRLIFFAVLVTNFFQYRHEKHELQETLNCHHNCSTMQYVTDLREELLRNKSIQCGPGNDLLESLNRAHNTWYSETKTASASHQHTGKNETYWFCYGIKCYSFIMDKKTWRGCKETCQNYRLSLLKIDDEDELKFLQPQVTPDSYWIGLLYDNEKAEWAWIDKGPSKLDLNIKKFKLNDGRCMFLSKTRLENINCDNLYSCICGKRLNKFPD